jgi:hypothetical protein
VSDSPEPIDLERLGDEIDGAMASVVYEDVWFAAARFINEQRMRTNPDGPPPAHPGYVGWT